MKLIGLIKSKTREKILKFFFSHKDKKYYLRELERRLKLPVGNIRRELISLEKMGLFKKEKVGNLVYYSLNENSPFFGVIENIVLASSKKKRYSQRTNASKMNNLIVMDKRNIELLRQKINELANILETVSHKESKVEDFLNLGVVVNKKGEVLLVRRANPEKGRGGAILTWAFPGGIQRFNESREECVARSVLSETGYKVKPFLEISFRFHPEFPVFVVYHLCRLISSKQVRKPMETSEIAEVKWVKPNQIKRLITTDLDLKVAKILK
ncbi:NUDIX domain-containing protein [bacterium]|nr:NUDIX domain-containing protein [bacterium]